MLSVRFVVPVRIMNVNSWFPLRTLVVVGALAGACSACSAPAPESPRDYMSTIASGRAIKDREFKSGSDSPVPPNRRDEMLPLGYFPIDPDYKTGATLSPSTAPLPWRAARACAR